MKLGLLASADFVATRNDFFQCKRNHQWIRLFRLYLSPLTFINNVFLACCFAMRYFQELKCIQEGLLYADEVCCNQFFHFLQQTC